MLRRIQRRLTYFYGLDRALDVVDFVRPALDEEREALLVKEDTDGVQLALFLPRSLLDLGYTSADPDTLLQAFEGVSHFVYLVERVRTRLPTTRLELELQAEVDKFVLLALDGEQLGAREREQLCERLFERVRFLHDADTENGERYRLANALAARYVRRLRVELAPSRLRAELCRFYRAGQAEKIRLASAA